MTQEKTQQRLAEWFRQWSLPLRKFLASKRAVRPADLDDVAQEVFLRLLRYERAELVEHPQAYLFKIALNVAAEWAIRARHRFPHDPKWLAEIPADEQPETVIARECVQDETEQAINALPAPQRHVLKLHFAEELEYVQIAERIGASPRAVKRSLLKSYAQLRRELKPDEFEGRRYGRK